MQRIGIYDTTKVTFYIHAPVRAIHLPPQPPSSSLTGESIRMRILSIRTTRLLRTCTRVTPPRSRACSSGCSSTSAVVCRATRSASHSRVH